MNRKATKIAIDHSKSNKYGIKDEYWKLIKENRRKVRRDWEFNINSPEFNDLKLLVDTMREAGADVQYVSILPMENGTIISVFHMNVVNLFTTKFVKQ